MYYKLTFNHDLIDESIDNGTYPIYAEVSNLKEIEYPGIKQGFFRNIFFETNGREITNWPVVDFYYSSKVSTLENEYLSNVNNWLIVHKKVKKEFEKQKIQGIQYLPVRVVDVLTHSVSHNYYAVNILNWIDGIDMEASEWEYEEEDDAYFFEPKGMGLDEQKCEGYDIFRCTKDTICIFVSEKIKKIFEKNNWQWFSLSEMPSTHKIKKTEENTLLSFSN